MLLTIGSLVAVSSFVTEKVFVKFLNEQEKKQLSLAQLYQDFINSKKVTDAESLHSDAAIATFEENMLHKEVIYCLSLLFGLESTE